MDVFFCCFDHLCVHSGKERIEKSQAHDEAQLDSNPEIIEIAQGIQKATEKAEEAGEGGDIDLAQELMKEVERLRERQVRERNS